MTPGCRCRRCCSASPRPPSAARRDDHAPGRGRDHRPQDLARRGVRAGPRRLVGQLGRSPPGCTRRLARALPAADPLAACASSWTRSAQPERGVRAGDGGAGRQPPPAREPVLLHGDFRLGNLIVGPEGLRAVLDWELTHVGNPAEDLGWLCVKAWRFGAAPAGRPRLAEELLAAYRAAGGADISPGRAALVGDPRHAALGRDLPDAGLGAPVRRAPVGRAGRDRPPGLRAGVGPAAAARPGGRRRAARARPRPTGDPRQEPAPFGRPTASELLDAVREFLTGSVMPATTGQLAFHARVAANVVAIVARELELGQRPGSPAGADLADRVAAACGRQPEVLRRPLAAAR